MEKSAAQLPPGFEWVDIKGKDKADQIFLTYGAHDIAVVRRLGNGWIAVIDGRYQESGSRTCLVQSRLKGQWWLARWLKLRAKAVQSSCQKAEPVQPLPTPQMETPVHTAEAGFQALSSLI